MGAGFLTQGPTAWKTLTQAREPSSRSMRPWRGTAVREESKSKQREQGEHSRGTLAAISGLRHGSVGSSMIWVSVKALHACPSASWRQESALLPR